MACDPLTHLPRQIEPGAVALEMVHHAKRMLVVAKLAVETLFEALVEGLLADVPERRVPEIVAEADRLDQVLVERQRARHRARDRGDLQGVGQAGSIVVAEWRYEHLRLVRQAAKRLAVHDPVPIALEGGAQPTILLCSRPPRRV
jgi:hypothetical protein